MGWKTPKFEYVNGCKVVETDAPTFKVYDGSDQVGEDFPYSGEAAAFAKSLPARDVPVPRNSGIMNLPGWFRNTSTFVSCPAKTPANKFDPLIQCNDPK